MLQAAPDAVLGTDRQARVQYVNRAAAAAFGPAAGAAVGESLWAAVPAFTSAGFREVYDRAVAAGEPGACTLLESAPVERRLELRVHPVAGGAAVHARDVTERWLAYADRRRIAHELARSNEELERFAYVASHDLQEPLRMVASFTELLGRRYAGELDDQADRYIRFAVDGARRMQRMIHDLLEYSRVGLSDGADDHRRVALDDIVSEALDNLSDAVERSGARITRDPLPVVPGSSPELVRVFQNLIANAIEYRSDAPPRIHVSAEASGPRWDVTVRDNGIGIAPEHRERIFEPFSRLHTREEHPGTGVGLALARKIVEQHGGRIRVESGDDGGSVFHLTLPMVEE